MARTIASDAFNEANTLLPVSAGFGVAERNEAQATSGGRRSGAVVKRREVKRSRTGRIQVFNFEWRRQSVFSAGFGETSGEARCGKSQSVDDLQLAECKFKNLYRGFGLCSASGEKVERRPEMSV